MNALKPDLLEKSCLINHGYCPILSHPVSLICFQMAISLMLGDQFITIIYIIFGHTLLFGSLDLDA
jgi:hypothetical protein